MNGGEGRRRETVEGVIEEAMPNALFRVRLSTGRVVSAGPSTSLRHIVVRLIPGSRVLVELSSHDPNRGNIIEKF